MWSIEIYIVGFVIVLVTQLIIIYKWRNPKCNGKLPPGSLGFPFIGECFELIFPVHSYDLHPFIKKRLQRYGPLFCTNVAGRNVVVSADSEFNNYIFQQEEKLVVRWYLDLFEKLFKQTGEIRPNGLAIHKYVKSMTLSRFGPECVKQNLLLQFEQLVQTTLLSWSTLDRFDLTHASVAMFGEFGTNQMCICDPETSKQLVDKFINGSRAIISFPLNIPGTTYYKSLKDKEKVMKMLKEIVNERIASVEDEHNYKDDLLSKLIKDIDVVDFITPEHIIHILFSLMFAIFQTIPIILVLAVKFISENPAVLTQLIAEHDEIIANRKNSDSSVTWEEYKSMTFTLQVVNETLRLGNTFPGFLRKAVKDIKVKGYTIPAGWAIMACHSALHLDPNIYKDPLKFDPSRWKDATPEFISKNLKPFGGGIKQCTGADFTRASLCIFLHVLVTKYRWNVVEGGDIIQNPVLHLKNGLHISLSERKNVN
ncbi:hypothetical protein ABFX02_02G026300 [Erythranthe guttata]